MIEFQFTNSETKGKNLFTKKFIGNYQIYKFMRTRPTTCFSTPMPASQSTACGKRKRFTKQLRIWKEVRCLPKCFLAGCAIPENQGKTDVGSADLTLLRNVRL